MSRARIRDEVRVENRIYLLKTVYFRIGRACCSTCKNVRGLKGVWADVEYLTSTLCHGRSQMKRQPKIQGETHSSDRL